MSRKESNKRPSSDSASLLSESGRKIIHYIQAGYPGLYLVSPEEQRVEAEIKLAVDQLNRTQKEQFQLSYWSVVTGLVNTSNHQVRDAFEPLEVLQIIGEQEERSITLLKDFHLFLGDPNPILVAKFKDVLHQAKTSNKTLLVLGCRLILPPELERELTVLDLPLPNKNALAIVLDGIVESANLPAIQNESRQHVLDSASGLTTIEAENAFALSVVECKAIDPTVVAREKANAVKRSGILEIIETSESLETIGGIDLLKDWLLNRKNAFSQRAIEYGLPLPKGLMIIGIAGTGKSLTAKATAAVFNIPLLKLDAGKIFAGLVGQSESNLRSVIQTAEAIAPCVLWIDELEKGFAGSKSSGSTDGGTSARVFGSFLSWMQEKKSPVFVVATANDVSQLPPELLRKGRWDELFFVDLPNQSERESIWKIQIQKHRRDPKDFDLVQLGKMTEGFTGAEIENVFVDAMYLAFEREQEPSDLTIAEVLNDSVPLSKLMTESIQGLRNWAKGRARMATTQPNEKKLRKLAA